VGLPMANLNSSSANFRAWFVEKARGLSGKAAVVAEKSRTDFRTLWSLVTSVALVLLVAASALQFGAWHKMESVKGPFPPAANAEGMVAVAVGETVPFQPLLVLRSDEVVSGTQPELRVRVNGEDRGNPGESLVSRFSRRLTYLYLTLPPGIPNNAGTVLTVKYSIKLHPAAYKLIVALLACLIGLRIGAIYLAREAGAPAKLFRATHRLTLSFVGVSWLVVATCALYAISIFYAVAAGYALPTAHVFMLLPKQAAATVAAVAPFTPIAMLVFAGIGTIASWLATLHVLDRRVVRRTEIILLRLWARAGLFVIFCIFLIGESVGPWAGVYRDADLAGSSFFGQLPFSDAMGYMESSSAQAISGHSTIIGARRPLAQALRDAFFLTSGYSHSVMILLQLGAIAVALFFAARSLARWHGIWVAIAFVGLIYSLARPFLATTLTEPLSLIPCLIALPFLIESFRRNSAAHGFVALGFITMALLVRMGSLFTIPAMGLWLAAAFGRDLKSKVRILILAGIAVISILVLNACLAALYSPQGVTVGSNFSLTLCGLSMGGSWNDCLLRIDTPPHLTESEQAILALQTAWDNVQANPALFVTSLLQNSRHYLRTFLVFHLSGYHDIFPSHPGDALGWAWGLLLLPGLIYVLRKRASFAERLWAPIIAASIVLSAAVVLADDGWRILFVTHALMAAGLALGYVAPASVAVPDHLPGPSSRFGFGMIAAATALLLAAPALSHAIMKSYLARHHLSAQANSKEDVLLGGNKMAGFVVTPDDAAPPASVASVRFSEFAALFRNNYFHSDPETLLAALATRLPFAFVWAPKVSVQWATYYVAPTKVLEEDVTAWRFTVERSSPLSSQYIVIGNVVEAQPVP
jgi:hypothetical protein